MSYLIDEQQIKAASHYGIPIFPIGEDGDTLLALGHHPPRRMLAAFNHCARDFFGWPNVADDRTASAADWAARMTQTHAVIRDSSDPDASWYADWSTPDAPGARPVTLLAVA